VTLKRINRHVTASIEKETVVAVIVVVAVVVVVFEHDPMNQIFLTLSNHFNAFCDAPQAVSFEVRKSEPGLKSLINDFFVNVILYRIFFI